jgi:putative ATP-binding cassette transporter
VKNLWWAVWRRSKYGLILGVCASAASGASRAGLLALVNAGFSGAHVSLRSYVLLCLAVPMFSLTAELVNVRTITDTMQYVMLRTVRQVLRIPLQYAEQIGAHRILTVLTQDVLMVTGGLQIIPALALHGSVVLGCVLYLAWLSPRVLMAALAFVVIGAITFRGAHLLARGHLLRARQTAEEIFRNLETMTRALKELKLSRQRRSGFLDRDLTPAAVEYRLHTLRSAAAYSLSGNWSQLIFFAVMGALIFAPSWTGASGRLVGGYGLTLLFLLGPLTAILGSTTVLATAWTAAGRLTGLIATLEPLQREQLEQDGTRLHGDWDAIHLCEVTHRYIDRDGATGFMLGPIDATIDRGDIVFLVGGNGSGKTTLAKMICGLYQPEAGEMRLGSQVIGPNEIGSYRELFGGVFSDYFLFDTIAGAEDGSQDAAIAAQLATFDLANKVKVQQGKYSTTAVSQGQRKRLALLTACLEGRQLLVFDEWAAEQDPTFKRLFYHAILPSLKASGKTVIVVTHDDTYFDVADQVIKLDFGQVVQRKYKTTTSSLAVSSVGGR